MKKIIEWSLFVGVVLLAWLFAGPSSLGGPASYVIVDGRSMEPTYEDGDLVVAFEREDYEVGDVIVYDAPVDSQFNVIHRIIERADGGFVTQGDNRDERDGWLAPDDQIYGAAVLHIPNGGAVVTFLRQPATILAVAAGWLTLALFKRRETDDGSDDDPSSTSQTADDTTEAQLPSGSLDVRVSSTAGRKTLALFGVAALLGGSAGIFVAHAAMLNVNAGVLQVFSLDGPESPEPPEADHILTIEIRYFNQGNGRELGSSPRYEEHTVPVGATYLIGWDETGSSASVACDSDDIVFDGDIPEILTGTGEFTLDGDDRHLLCVRTAPGQTDNRLLFAVLAAPNTLGAASTSNDRALCDEYEGAAFCRGDSDQAGEGRR